MRYHWVLIIGYYGFVCFANVLKAQSCWQVMTFNIRFDHAGDGDNRWAYRKANVASLLSFYEADICGMQEVLLSQIQDLQTLLPAYAYTGVGRDDGGVAGEFSPVFYRKDKFELIGQQTFWLSPTPDMPSRGWDAALNRIATWVHLQPISGEEAFYVFNTHFDHIGQEARRESARLLIQKIEDIAGNAPVILTGDLNSSPEDDPILLLREALTDAKTVSQSGHFGPDSTFNKFENKEIEGMRIDYVFINRKSIRVLKHATLSHTWGGRFASDHHPVLVSLCIE